MASIKYASHVSEVSGKLGNAIYQRMGQSLGIRNTAVRGFSVNDRAIALRVLFSRVSLEWNSLNSVHRQTWVTNAPSYPATDKFGNPINLSGYQLYLQVNLVRALYSLTSLVAAVPFYIVPSTSFSLGNIHKSSNQWLYDGQLFAGENMRLLIYVTDQYPPLSVDRNPKTKFLQSFDFSIPRTSNLLAVLEDSCGIELVVGKSIYVELWLQSVDTGVFKRYSGYWSEII